MLPMRFGSVLRFCRCRVNVQGGCGCAATAGVWLPASPAAGGAAAVPAALSRPMRCARDGSAVAYCLRLLACGAIGAAAASRHAVQLMHAGNAVVSPLRTTKLPLPACRLSVVPVEMHCRDNIASGKAPAALTDVACDSRLFRPRHAELGKSEACE